jgi:hypothetical protein
LSEDRTPQAAYDARIRAERQAVIGAAAASVPAPAEQPALLPELAPAEPRPGGRPPGAQSRATREWVRHLLANYGSPLEKLLQVAAQDLDQLMREAGATRLEAFDRRMAALKEALPYLHQKLPQSIQVDGAPLMAVQITVSPGLAAMLDVGGQTIEADQGLASETSA